MNIPEILAAVLVYKHLSFSKAAQELHLSQPAVSKQVKLLEERLGFALFWRNKRTVKTTSQGKEFLEGIIPVIHQLEGLMTPNIKKTEQNILKLGSHIEFGQSLLVKAIGASFDELSTHLEIILASEALLVEMLEAQQIDAMISIRSYINEQMQCYPFFEEEFCLVTKGQKFPDLNALEAIPFAIYRHNDPIFQVFSQKVLGKKLADKVVIKVKINSYRAILSLVEDLGLFAVVPKHVLIPQESKANCIHPTFKMKNMLYFVELVGAKRQKDSRSLRHILKQRLKTNI